jgi:DNA polymerase-4
VGGIRTILHVDMDAFYVSVEIRRRPELRGLPVVVGGSGRRGVVAAASYEARRFGVHSAMPSAVARQRCPGAIFLDGDHAHYAEVSAQVHDVLHRYTPIIEPLALDEAFLDVTGAGAVHGDGLTIATSLRAAIGDELSLGCSVGVASNKFIAKLASVEAKPVARPEGVVAGRGVVVVAPGDERAFVGPLPVERLAGVGPATEQRLHSIGIRHVADLTAIDIAALRAALGTRQADHLRDLADGVDDRPVESDRAVKSIGHEETFSYDLFDLDLIDRELVRMADSVSSRLRHSNVGARTVTLKARYGDFTTITRSTTVAEPVTTAAELLAAVRPLVRDVDRSRGVRLLGISGSKLGPPYRQLSLDDADSDDDHNAADAVDAIRTRFGHGAIGPASGIDRRVEDGVQTCDNGR